MAKGESKADQRAREQAQRTAREGLTQTAAATQPFVQQTGAAAEQARGMGQSERQYLEEQYKRMLSPDPYQGLRGITGAGGGGAAVSGAGGGGEERRGPIGGYSNDEGIEGLVEPPGGGLPAVPPPDPWAPVKGVYNDMINTGGFNYAAATEALGGFRDLSGTGGIGAGTQANLDALVHQYRNIAKTPIERARLEEALTGLKTAGQTGGYDPAKYAALQEQITGLRNFQTMTPEQAAAFRSQIGELTNFNPALSAEDIARFRGTGFGEFAETGGFTPENLANIRGRIASQTPAFYRNLQAEQERRSALTGQMYPGMAASQRALAREAARGGAEAVREGEIGLAEQIRQGRQYGITGLRDTESLLQQEIGRRLDLRREALAGGINLGTGLEFGLADRAMRAREGALTAQGQLEADIAANRIRGYESAASQELAMQRAEQEARLSALAGERETYLDPIRISNEAKLRALSGITETAQGAEEMYQRGRLQGAQGLAGIIGQEQAAASYGGGGSSGGGGGGGGGGGYTTDGYETGGLTPYQIANLGSQNERFAVEGQFNALGGLADLYSSAPGPAKLYGDQFLGGVGAQTDAYKTLAGVSQPPQQTGASTWQRIGAGIGAAGLTAATALTQGLSAPYTAGPIAALGAEAFL